MYQLKFTLKQHTPIIHFQHDQDGATLRATEVKPKLDRFIIEKLGKEADNTLTDYEAIYKKGKEIANKNGWLIDKDKGALNYKMRIEKTSNKVSYLPLARHINNNKQRYLKEQLNIDFEYLMPTNYFANEDKIKFYTNQDDLDIQNSNLDAITYGLLSISLINTTIHTYKEDLKNKFELHLNEFFITNNFGNRNNKGFGSFTIKENIIGNVILNNNFTIIQSKFLKKNQIINGTLVNIFEKINNEYQLLKSGTNQPYKKSELFKYFINQNIRWEKRIIKQRLNANGVYLTQRNFEPIDYNNALTNYYNSYTDIQSNDYKYIRAFLGLAEHLEFATRNRGRLKVKIKHVGHAIERFQSPIMFKVIDNNIYISVNDSYILLFNEQFEFIDGSTSLFTLRTPNSFDIRSFINSHISSTWINI